MDGTHGNAPNKHSPIWAELATININSIFNPYRVDVVVDT